nr:hypothetical protein [Marivivens donghaensis]
MIAACERLVLRRQCRIERRRELRCQELPAQFVEDARLDRVLLDRLLVCARALPRFAASEVIAPCLDVWCPAASALHEPREEILAPPRADGIALAFGFRGLCCQLCFDAVPKRLIDDPQRRDLDLVRSVRRGEDFPAVGLGMIAPRGLPDAREPDVEPVAQHAFEARRIAAQGAVVPRPSARRRVTFRVEPPDDGLRRVPLGELAKDAAHDLGLGGIDLAVQPLVGVETSVPVGTGVQPQPRQALDHAAPRVLTDRLRIELRAKAVDQHSDEVLRTLVDGMKLDLRELHQLELGHGNFDAAGETVDRFDDDNIDEARVDGAAQRLEPLAARCATGLLAVHKPVRHRPALACGKAFSVGDLILDRGLLLQTRAEAGVDGDAFRHWAVSFVGAFGLLAAGVLTSSRTIAAASKRASPWHACGGTAASRTEASLAAVIVFSGGMNGSLIDLSQELRSSPQTRKYLSKNFQQPSAGSNPAGHRDLCKEAAET